MRNKRSRRNRKSRRNMRRYKGGNKVFTNPERQRLMEINFNGGQIAMLEQIREFNLPINATTIEMMRNTIQNSYNNDINAFLESLKDEEGYTSGESEGGRKTRRNRRDRRRGQKGGRCYGSGVGANSYDPNYSIYNTPMLKLFPYKA